MEQEIQSQPQQLIVPQDNKNKIISAVVVSVLVTALVVGAGVYFFATRGSNKLADQQNIQNSTEPTPTAANNTVATGINPKDYSLVNYPLKQSVVYSQLDKDCLDSYWSDAKDTRLVKNQTEILIPSLLQVIFSSENQKPNCAMSVTVFSAPTDGKYLYLQTSHNTV